jgi:hypothetical protein
MNHETICETADLLRLKEPQGDKQRAWRKRPKNKEKERKRENWRQKNEFSKIQRRQMHMRVPGGIKCKLCGRAINGNEGCWHHPDYNKPYEAIPCHKECHRKSHNILDALLTRTGFLPFDIETILRTKYRWMPRKKKDVFL